LRIVASIAAPPAKSFIIGIYIVDTSPLPCNPGINDLPVKAADRKYFWPQGRRPDDHPGLSQLGLQKYPFLSPLPVFTGLG
jgi:hypothetical protein